MSETIDIRHKLLGTAGPVRATLYSLEDNSVPSDVCDEVELDGPLCVVWDSGM